MGMRENGMTKGEIGKGRGEEGKVEAVWWLTVLAELETGQTVVGLVGAASGGEQIPVAIEAEAIVKTVAIGVAA